jgi:hypothetical protein
MFDKNGAITKNFFRVETYGDIEQSWVELTINPNEKQMFTFKPIVLKSIKK